MPFFPVNLDIRDRRCLVIGGGNVALRKIDSLLGCQAQVTVISPKITAEIASLVERGDISWCQREYMAGDLAGAFMVFAATDNAQVQKAISAEARELGVLLNSVDNPKRCDFQLPAKIRRGDLLLTVSTAGASPALSKLIRQQLEILYGEEYVAVVDLLASLREIIIGSSKSSLENKKVFQELLESDMVDYARKGDWQRVSAILSSLLPGDIEVATIVTDVKERNTKC